MSRPIVSYDDITLPYDVQDVRATAPPPQASAGHPPPSKKRKKNNNQKSKQRNNNNWSNSMKEKAALSSSHQEQIYLNTEPVDEGEYYEEGEEESRELTHEEIWDDSALVNAWDAAMEEYEAYHGTDKEWKQEPVKKSALWYNIPIDPTKISGKAEATSAVTAKGGPTVHIPEELLAAAADGEEDGEENSKPLDFNTFVPTYDPTLDPSPPADQDTARALPTAPSANYAADFTSGPGQMVTQDEAFQRALSAMYWGGYWTAMYHAQRYISSSSATTAPTVFQPGTSTEVNECDNEEDEEEEDDKIPIDDDAFVSTQR